MQMLLAPIQTFFWGGGGANQLSHLSGYRTGYEHHTHFQKGTEGVCYIMHYSATSVHVISFVRRLCTGGVFSGTCEIVPSKMNDCIGDKKDGPEIDARYRHRRGYEY